MKNSKNSRIRSGLYESVCTGFSYNSNDEWLDTGLDFCPQELVRGDHYVLVHQLVNIHSQESYQFVEIIEDGLWFSKAKCFFNIWKTMAL